MMISTSCSILFLIVVVQLAGTHGQKVFDGECPFVTVFGAPDENTLPGSWYLQYSYQPMQPKVLRCTTYDFGPGTSNEYQYTYPVTITSFTPNGTEVTSTGTFMTTSPYNYYSVAIVGSPVFPANFLILNLGSNWIAAISCTEIMSSHLVQIYILTDTRFPTQSTLNDALAAVSQSGLSTKFLFRTKHQNCE